VTLELVRTPDILKGLGEAKGGRVLVGFAAETEDLVANARKKLEGKSLDLVVANDVTAAGAGFGGDTNAVVLLRRDGGRVDVPLASKREVAERILDEVRALRAARA
jgi:phosphopantothenoylcysteine decarboxylase/phosphopantothenate--cysteine ligase